MAGYILRAFLLLQLGNNCPFMWLCKSPDRLNMWEYCNKAAVKPSRFHFQNLCYEELQTKKSNCIFKLREVREGGTLLHLPRLSVCLCACVRVSACMSVSVCLCLCVCLPVCVSLCLSVCLSVWLCVCLSVCAKWRTE